MGRHHHPQRPHVLTLATVTGQHGALTAQLEDLDAATLAIMRDELGCEKAVHVSSWRPASRCA